MTPKTATLKIDDEAKTLDADGKFTTDVDFDTKLKLVTELDGYEVDTQDVTILSKDNIVNINLSKAKVRQKQEEFPGFFYMLIFFFYSLNLRSLLLQRQQL